MYPLQYSPSSTWAYQTKRGYIEVHSLRYSLSSTRAYTKERGCFLYSSFPLLLQHTKWREGVSLFVLCSFLSLVVLCVHNGVGVFWSGGVLEFPVSDFMNIQVRTQWRKSVFWCSLCPTSSTFMCVHNGEKVFWYFLCLAISILSCDHTSEKVSVLMFYLINSLVRTNWRQERVMLPVCVSYSLSKQKKIRELRE